MDQAADDVDEGRLAGAVRTEHADHRDRHHAQGDAVESTDAPELAHHVGDLDRRRRPRCGSTVVHRPPPVHRRGRCGRRWRTTHVMFDRRPQSEFVSRASRGTKRQRKSRQTRAVRLLIDYWGRAEGVKHAPEEERDATSEPDAERAFEGARWIPGRRHVSYRLFSLLT